jgi:hypothetical protein
MFVPIVLGSDKTTVSVATGSNEYYPLYLSTGNLHHHVRRAHRNAVTPIAFLAIPHGRLIIVLLSCVCNSLLPASHEHNEDPKFRKFRRQVYHSSLERIFLALLCYMTRARVTKCCDGYFRRAIYGLGPYIGDYLEQVVLACIVQGWCARYVLHYSCL